MGDYGHEGQSAGVSVTDDALLDIPLGDLMRGERATMGKSLLDVERELKIRASHIAAIENADLSAFATKGFIAGYVRSYARYLGMEPDATYARFSAEAGFGGVHGLSGQQAQGAKRSFGEAPGRMHPNDVIASSRISFAPMRESILSKIEPGALGSAAVLIALVAGIGYGAWSVLTEIQRVQFVPVAEAPETYAELDPLAGAASYTLAAELPGATTPAVPGQDGFDRLYRPQVLETPVLTPRDGAIATLDPNREGNFGVTPALSAPEAPVATEIASAVQVTEEPSVEEVLLYAVRPTWIRVSSASGAVLFEGTLNSGDSYAIPEGTEGATLRAGNAGSLYFAVNGVTLGPSGPGATIARNVVLDADQLSENYSFADASADPDLSRVAEIVLGGE